MCCVASSWASCKLDARYLPHEANVAQVFSRAGNLSDPNIDPEFLAHLVMVSVNKKAFQPSIEAIKNTSTMSCTAARVVRATVTVVRALQMVMRSRRCARVRPAPPRQGRSRMKSEVKVCSSVCV